MEPSADGSHESARVGHWRISQASSRIPKLQLTQRALAEAFLAKMERLGTPEARSAAQAIRASQEMQKALLDMPDNFVLTLAAIKHGARLDEFQSRLLSGAHLGRNLLHRCAETNDHALLERLLRAPGLVNRADREGRTPLALALEASAFASVALLLSHGADPNTRMGEVPILHVALAARSREEANDAALRLLLDGADPNARDTEGRTALHVAIPHAPLSVLAALLTMRAHVDAADYRGRTAMHRLVSDEATHPARMNFLLLLLLRAGASIDALDCEGNAPLHIAPSEHAYMQLMREGANPKLRNRQRQTPVDEWRQRTGGADPPILPFPLHKIP